MLLQAQYGSEAFDKLADMIYDTLDQYGIYQQYLHYSNYNKLMLQSTGATATTEGKLQSCNFCVLYTLIQKLMVGRDIIYIDNFVVYVASSEPPSRVVTPLQSTTAAGAGHNVDMSYYNKLLSHVPEERTTIELILHCMIEQVCLLIR